MNTTLLFTTPNFAQLPVLTQEWEYNDFKLYSYTPNELVGVSNQPVVIYLHMEEVVSCLVRNSSIPRSDI